MLFEELLKQLSYKIFPQKRLSLSPKRAVASLSSKQATTAKCSCSASLSQRAASQSKTAIMLTISYYTAKKEKFGFCGKFR
jgi:hypothetical protein